MVLPVLRNFIYLFNSTPGTSGGGLRVLLDRRGAGRVVSEEKEDGEDKDDG